jgi:predicted transglutaminase-like cysteine proteinase
MPILHAGKLHTAAKALAMGIAACSAIGGGVQAAPFMRLGDAASAPLAFLDFCTRHPQECLIVQPTPGEAGPDLAEAAPPIAEAMGSISASEAPQISPPAYLARLFSHRGDLAHLALELPTEPAAALPAPLALSQRFSAFTVLAPPAPPTPLQAGWKHRASGGSLAVRLALASADPSPSAPVAAASPPKAAVAVLTPELMQLLTRVNRDVNGAISKRDDTTSAFGLADHWDLPIADAKGARAYGDCEDYVLEKRRALAAAGLPPQALSMAIARTRRGELHAVLVVTTDRGEFVLDNLSPWVTPWAELNYDWVQRQVAGSAFTWAAIQAG